MYRAELKRIRHYLSGLYSSWNTTLGLAFDRSIKTDNILPAEDKVVPGTFSLARPKTKERVTEVVLLVRAVQHLRQHSRWDGMHTRFSPHERKHTQADATTPPHHHTNATGLVETFS